MSDHKIAQIEAIPLRIPFDHYAPAPMFGGRPRSTLDSVLVKVTTDKGLVGWGEAYGSLWQGVVPALDVWVAPLALGEDPADEGLTTRIERALHNLGRAGASVQAVSGLDIALWDLRGKLEGVSVSTLLGGRRRTRIEAYASLLQYGGRTDDIRRVVTRSLEAGYRQVKLHERTPQAAAAARAEMGAGMPLMVDTNCAWLPEQAADAVAAMAPYDLTWIEEPVWPPEDFEALAAVRKATGIPTAIGENATGVLDFQKMITARAVDYVQPCVIKIGGITRLWQICTYAEANGIECVPHAPFFGPGFLAVLHVLAAKKLESALERLVCDLGYTPFATTFPVKDGHVEVPDGPGLGADPEPELIAHCRA